MAEEEAMLAEGDSEMKDAGGIATATTIESPSSICSACSEPTKDSAEELDQFMQDRLGSNTASRTPHKYSRPLTARKASGNMMITTTSTHHSQAMSDVCGCVRGSV